MESGDVLHTVHGTFKLKRGNIRFDPSTGKTTGEIVIDVTSGETGNGTRDRKMHQEILESQKYPDAVFSPDKIEGHLDLNGDSTVDVHGLFRIHGADHELVLHIQSRMNQGQLTGNAHFEIPYQKWGMRNPSTFLLKVNDHVDMDVKIVALK